ncbi:MAG: carboxypeptidase regulatory-like domain-containing protein, partial [Blastocatellia bacterium]
MSKLKFISLILALVGFLSLESLAQSQARESKEGTATISGRVTLKGEPMRNVIVALQPEQTSGQSNQESGSRVKTDENGRFRITGVAAGRFVLSALAPGFAGPEEDPRGSYKSLSVSDGGKIENIEFAFKRGGVITGRVTDSNGKPLVDDKVALTKLDENGKPSNFGGSTDDRGIYRIYGLPMGRYLVSASRWIGGVWQVGEGPVGASIRRCCFPPTYHPGVTDKSQAKIIEVNEGFEVTGVDITVADPNQAYDVFGRAVYADSGQPVVGVEIAYYSMIGGGKSIGTRRNNGERTNSLGEFHLQGLRPGFYAASIKTGNNREIY